MQEYLEPTSVIDSDHPEILDFARKHAADPADERAAAVRVYYAVRDGIRYDPYGAGADADSLRASNVLAAGRGWCVSKAVLLGACCRALGIPARLGFADVRNHLSTERMRRTMKTDVFYYHGYTSIYLEGVWRKATPAFNVELCEKFRLRLLEFDGLEDSLYHAFDQDGRKHMEYLNDRGEFADVPIDDIQSTFREHYPGLALGTEAADFDADVARETGVDASSQKIGS